MGAESQALIQQIDAVLARGGLSPGQFPSDQFFFQGHTPGSRTALATAWTAAIDRLSPRSSEYRAQVLLSLNRFAANHPKHLQSLAGILNALRADYEEGYMTTIEELIHADVFADFLGMAAELIDKGYKDPAAVLTGSVLEEHVRKLCDRHDVPIAAPDGSPRKADTLNAELVKAGAYGKLDQKSVTAWLGLRNDAAHGHYDRYEREQVALMLESVRNFLSRHPA
jgi:hypothetical protein